MIPAAHDDGAMTQSPDTPLLPKSRETSPEAGGNRVARSRAALISRFPKLETALSAETVAREIWDGKTVVDLDLGPARLYAADGRALAARQVETYLEKPLRFFVTSVRGANTGSQVSWRILDFMFAECRLLGISLDDLEVKPQYEGSYLVVLGVGLGYHLEALIEQTRARHIILIEPYADFLCHSLATLEWAALLEQAESRGCKFTVSLANQPDDIVSTIQSVFSTEGVPFIDGTYVFLHYPAWELFQARDRLAQAVETLFVSRGYYEDEVLMLTNTLSNLAGAEFSLMDLKLRPVRSEPVFLIGSGPSVDQTIEQVKRLRDRAIVFSCGTGLKICLAHGIVPDFHAEIENGDWVYDALALLNERYGLGGITLVATLSVDPRVPGLFEDRVLFFRDSISGTRILAPPGTEIYGAVPTVANTAMRMAMGMGFTTLYLFGIDCGTKSEAKKHSTLAVYNDSARFKQFEDMMEMAYSAQGNFGGLVKADWVFNFSRMMLERLASSFGLKVYNCSDGARIAGTIPRVATSVTLPGKALDRTLLKTRLRAALSRYQPSELLADTTFETLRRNAEQFRTDLLAVIETAIAEDRDFVAFWRRLSPFIDDAMTRYAKTSTVITASLVSMPKIGMFFVHRIREVELRQQLYQAFLGEYREVAAFMCDGLLALLDTLAQQHGPALAAVKAAQGPTDGAAL